MKISAIYRRNHKLQQLFDSVYPAATFNFGPRAITQFHKDWKNKANRLLSITSLGQFDYRRGGHIVLKTFGIAIEFPAGSTIMFLSSVIEHANTPVADGEERYSFCQYAAGGLFRWYDYGFKLWKQMKSAKPSIEAAQKAAEKDAWVNALNKLSIAGELRGNQCILQ